MDELRVDQERSTVRGQPINEIRSAVQQNPEQRSQRRLHDRKATREAEAVISRLRNERGDQYSEVRPLK